MVKTFIPDNLLRDHGAQAVFFKMAFSSLCSSLGGDVSRQGKMASLPGS